MVIKAMRVIDKVYAMDVVMRFTTSMGLRYGCGHAAWTLPLTMVASAMMTVAIV